MSEIERKFQMFECGCALRRGCTQHGELTYHKQYDLTAVTAERDWEKTRADRLETQLAEKNAALQQREERIESQSKLIEKLTAEVCACEQDGNTVNDPCDMHKQWAEEQLKAKDELLRRLTEEVCAVMSGEQGSDWADRYAPLYNLTEEIWEALKGATSRKETK